MKTHMETSAPKPKDKGKGKIKSAGEEAEEGQEGIDLTCDGLHPGIGRQDLRGRCRVQIPANDREDGRNAVDKNDH